MYIKRYTLKKSLSFSCPDPSLFHDRIYSTIMGLYLGTKAFMMHQPMR